MYVDDEIIGRIIAEMVSGTVAMRDHMAEHPGQLCADLVRVNDSLAVADLILSALGVDAVSYIPADVTADILRYQALINGEAEEQPGVQPVEADALAALVMQVVGIRPDGTFILPDSADAPARVDLVKRDADGRPLGPSHNPGL